MSLRRVVLSELTITDESAFAHVALYAKLKRALRDASYPFHVAETGKALSWDRATFLNLTYWSAAEGADVLCESSIPADVVAHVGWHHLASKHLTPDAAAAPCAEALFFGEAIASAFDLYLVGRLLRHVPDSDFIATQVEIMGEAAEQAGMPPEDFEALLEAVVLEPERAFEDLRALLFDASRALYACRNVLEANAALERFDAHRFGALLHHYQLSNWVLYARAYGRANAAQEQAVLELDQTLRTTPVALDWLERNWLG